MIRHTQTDWQAELALSLPHSLPVLDFPGLPSEAEPLCQSQVEVAACTFDASLSSWFTEYQMSSGTGGAERWHWGQERAWVNQHPSPVAHVLLQPFGRFSWGCPISKALLGKGSETLNSDLPYNLLLSLLRASVCLWLWCHVEGSQKYHSDLIHCVDCKLIWRGPSLWIWNVKARFKGNVLRYPWFSVFFSCSTSANTAHCELTRWLSCSQHPVGRSGSPFPLCFLMEL